MTDCNCRAIASHRRHSPKGQAGKRRLEQSRVSAIAREAMMAAREALEIYDWHLTAAREICAALAEIDSVRHGGGAFGGQVYRDGMCDDMPEVKRVLEILREEDTANRTVVTEGPAYDALLAQIDEHFGRYPGGANDGPNQDADAPF